MTNIDSNRIGTQDINAQKVPCQGPRTCPLTLDFGIDTDLEFTAQNFVQRGFLEMIQGVYVDNSNNSQPMTVTCPDTRQSITWAPGRQGYKVVLCPNPPTLQFHSTGGVRVNIQILNFPVTNSDWASA